MQPENDPVAPVKHGGCPTIVPAEIENLTDDDGAKPLPLRVTVLPTNPEVADVIVSDILLEEASEGRPLPPPNGFPVPVGTRPTADGIAAGTTTAAVTIAAIR